MPVELSPKAVMSSMVRMFGTGDVSEADDVVSPDYVDHQGLGSGPIFGADGFRDVVAAARSGFTKLETSVLDLIAEGDKVVARIEWRGTRPSADVERRETIDILRVVAGRAVEHWGARG